MQLAPRNVFAPYFAAGTRILAGDLEAALELQRRAVELDSNSPWTWLVLGWIHLDLDRQSEALRCLEKAVEREQCTAQATTAGASGYLGEGLRRMGRQDEARKSCMAGLEAVERSDHMYRDTIRGVCLCALGRTALEQGDRSAARVAFDQAVLHLRGRPAALGGGHLLVQALAGNVRAGGDAARFDEALELFERREDFNFSWMLVCSEDVTLLELARAAQAIDRNSDARDFLTRALAAGSTEARKLELSADPGQHS